MKVGLFFGSFNPIHTGHLIIANYVANFFSDEVWFVVSPQNPFKKTADLLDPTQRLLLTESATQSDNRFKVLAIEFNLPQPSYTINTLQKLTADYPNEEFHLIIGSDNLESLPQWKDADTIINNYNILVYERPGFEISKTEHHQNITILKPGLLDISSTAIRKLISENKSVRYLVPDNVLESIEKNKFYR